MKIEGRNAVAELVRSGARVEKIIVQNGLHDPVARALIAEIGKASIPFSFADKAVLDREGGDGRHQGFIAFAADYRYADIGDFKDGDFVVILDEVLDPHNLGSIIRVCECAGVDGLVIPERRSASVNETVMRVSEGAVNHLKVAKVANINAAIDFLKRSGYWVTGAELGGESLYSADLKGRLALVIGGEGTGIKRLTREKCDRIVTIPMRGKVNSLNASVACGVVVFEAVRQRE